MCFLLQTVMQLGGENINKNEKPTSSILFKKYFLVETDDKIIERIDV